MDVLSILGFAAAVVMILVFWGFVIYMGTMMVRYLIPDIAARMDARVKGLCRKCGMAKQLGHWPGCDYWTGENLDLLIFKESNDDGTPQ